MNVDLIIRGGLVRTLDPRHPVAEAVAIGGGMVVGVGDDDEIAALGGAGVRTLDAAGATILPGFVDGHIHPVLAVDLAVGVDLTECGTLEQVRTALAEQCTVVKAGSWLRAWGLNPNALGGLPMDRRILDHVVGDRPALVLVFDGHAALASSAALHRAGITGPRDLGPTSSVVCAADGIPTGHLLEERAVALVLDVVPEPDPAARADSLAAVLDRLAASGLTGGHVMDLADGDVELYRSLERDGRLPMRLRLAPWCRPGEGPARWAELLELQAEHGRLWRVGAVKFFLDGTIDGGTAWLHRPDRDGGSARSGWPDLAEFSRAVGTFAAARVQTATHAIGDAAVAHALTALAGVVPAGSGARHRIEHIETMTDDQLPRFAELDVVASMQPIHATDFTSADHTDNWSARIGAERAERGWRYRDLINAGATVVLGSDWPVADFDPRKVLAAAITRRPAAQPEHIPVGDEQRLTIAQALAGYTTAAAYATGDEHRAGRIAPGLRADLTVLTGDPLVIPPAELGTAAVVATVVDGVVRFGAERLG